jgi:hypothetical protein
MNFKNVVKNLILENEKANFLYNKFVYDDKTGEKKGPKIPFKYFLTLLNGDPTTQFLKPIDEIDEKRDGKNLGQLINVGKYSEWIIDRFLKPKVDDPAHPLNVLDKESSQYKSEIKSYRSLFIEDLYKTKEDLAKFNRFKDRIPAESRQLNKLSTQQLYDLVKYFSLEKVKTSKDERKEIAKSYQHPGAEIVYRDGNWTVARITENPLGKDAAIFYGGFDKKPVNGETGWCTSGPNLSYYEGYVAEAPLYVVLPNEPMPFKNYEYSSGEQKGEKILTGDVTGLPAFRLQFHFSRGSHGPQFKDPEDREIDLPDFLNSNPGLKQFFKPMFFSSMGNVFRIDLSNDKMFQTYSEIYGDTDFLQYIPKDIDNLIITNSKSLPINLDLSNVLGEFKNLETLHLSDVIDELPDSVCSLDNLIILVLSKNQKLNTIPECLKNLPNLEIINLLGSNPDLVIPTGLIEKLEQVGNKHFYKMIQN